MPRKLRELRQDLRRAGFYLDHQTGSHQVWKHDALSGAQVNLAGKDGADAKRYQERDVTETIIRVKTAEMDGKG